MIYWSLSSLDDSIHENSEQSRTPLYLPVE